MRITVVGAGIVGSAIAFHLARRGAQVALLDAGEPGMGASSHSFAWINAFGKEPRHYNELNRRSLDTWDRYTRLLSADVGLKLGRSAYMDIHRWGCGMAQGECRQAAILGIRRPAD